MHLSRKLHWQWNHIKVYMDDINLLPVNWKMLIDANETYSKARVIADYIAGMTDRFAIQEYNQLCSLNFNNI